MTLYESSNILMDLLKLLSSRYYKVVRIDIAKDHYEEIICPEGTEGCQGKISEWLWTIPTSDTIHEDDFVTYTHMNNLSEVRDYLIAGSKSKELKYRRKIGEEFRWMSMEVIPSTSYTDSNQVFMLYIKDIHDSYNSQRQEIEFLRRESSRDALTGLCNRKSYDDRVTYLESIQDPIGIIYTDLNNLKVINDTQGHAAGDKYLLEYAHILKSIFREEDCYRYGGDEFIILLPNVSEHILKGKIAGLKEKLSKSTISAAIGYRYSKVDSDLQSDIQIAEARMYENKMSMKSEIN